MKTFRFADTLVSMVPASTICVVSLVLPIPSFHLSQCVNLLPWIMQESGQNYGLIVAIKLQE